MRSTSSPDTDDSSSKRSRIVGKQSKHGCFTCKYADKLSHEERKLCDLYIVDRARKIKCDESKPTCSRCQRSNVKCEGYPRGAYSDGEIELYFDQSEPKVHQTGSKSIPKPENRPAYALLDGFRKSPVQDRLAQIGCSVLQDGLRDQFEVSRAVFDCLLPQLSYALPSVHAAAAALGAVCEMQTAALTTFDGKKWLVGAQYNAAIREVQYELRSRPYGAVPILIACVLLACADVLLRRPIFALMHLQGALGLLEERNAISTLASGSSPPSLGDASHESSPIEDPLPLEEADDEITALFRTFDVQTSSYADGRQPGMQIAQVRTSQDPVSSPVSLQRSSRELIAIIHACYCFTSQASHCKYLPQKLVPVDLFFEQGHHIGALKLWLRRLTRDILPTLKASSNHQSAGTAKYTHCLVLRNLCISTIIYASTILDPYETAWDTHASSFQDIVTGAELIHNHRRRGQRGFLPSSTTAFTFSPSPGIIQPLYLTVLKYRHPIWRRRALEVLRHSGKEGPWDGKLMAAAAQCTVDAEESELARDVDSSVRVEQVDEGLRHLEDIVPERVRVSGCGPMDDIDAERISGLEWTADRRNLVQVGSGCRPNFCRIRLSRCRDVNRMLAAGLEEQDTAEKPAFTHERHWEMWEGNLEF